MNWIIRNINEIKVTLFHIMSWCTSLVFFYLGIGNISLTYPDKIHPLFLSFILVGLLFLFLPFFKKIKLGNIELEREIEQTKKEVSDLKIEIRQQIQMLSTNINTIGNLSNHININLPGTQDIKDEINSIEKTIGSKKIQVEKIKDELILPGEDNIIALAKLRIKIEYLIRKKLEKQVQVSFGMDSGKDIKFYSLSNLVREFLKKYPQHSNLERSLDYALKVCNAAIHSQHISESQTSEVLQLGANIIAILEE